MEAFPKIKISGITVITVRNQGQGLNVAKDILYKKVDGETLLFLSGGSTPKSLYEAWAREKKLKVKAVGMVDERIDRSNYEMIKATGLLDYLNYSKIKFYPMISASSYHQEIHSVVGTSKKKAAIMGIGSDGHTAGLPAGIQNSKFKIQNYVTEINDFPGEHKNRITLTFNALAHMDLLIILAFGENKKEALKKVFEKGPLEEIPARFYIKPEIARKTILITDQKV